MTFTTPFGLLALLAVPAVVALHLFRNKLPERRVAGLFLFPPEALLAGAGRTRTRLLRTPSFWLELLAALLLGLWLGGLSFGGARSRHVVVVLDDSASMAAGGRDRALAALRQRLGALGGGDFVSVLRTGPRPEVLAGPKALPHEALAVLDGWQPTLPRHERGPTLDLGRELAMGGGELWFLTDEAPGPADLDVTWLAFGQSAPNAAILGIVREPGQDGQERVRAHLAAFGAIASSELVLRTGARELQRARAEFADGEATVVVPLPAGVDVLHASLSTDALAIDSAAWLLPAPVRDVRVCDQLPSVAAEALAIPRLLTALPAVRNEADSRMAQLLLRAMPGPLRAGQLELVVAGDGERRALAGPFVIDRAHAVCSGLSLQGVVFGAVVRDLPGAVLVAAGAMPLCTEEPLDEGRRFWLALDPQLGNFARSPDWPVLMANLVEQAREQVPGPLQTQVLVGGEARFRRGPDSDPADPAASADPEFQRRRTLWLLGPDGVRVEGHGDRTVGFPIRTVGVHTVQDHAQRPLGSFAARFLDASESDLRLLRTMERAASADVQAARQSAARDTGWERRVLALLLFVVVLLDWWVLARRDT
jgi:hypothetical protein